MTKKKSPDDPLCEAVTRRQTEGVEWSMASFHCQNHGVEQVDGHWVCNVHKDPSKRYGWNRFVN